MMCQVDDCTQQAVYLHSTEWVRRRVYTEDTFGETEYLDTISDFHVCKVHDPGIQPDELQILGYNYTLEEP